MAKILIIDDNVSLLSAMADILTDADHLISVAKNGQQAMVLIDAKRFDLIIIDIHMPVMNGIEVLMALRQKFPGQKTIVMSGGGEAYNTVNGLRVAKLMGAMNLMSKPFSMKELLETVTSVLNHTAPHLIRRA